MAKIGNLIVKGFMYPEAYLIVSQPDIINNVICYQIYANQIARLDSINNIIDGGQIQCSDIFTEEDLKKLNISPRAIAYKFISTVDRFAQMTDAI